jgi:membrane associated rhomboid family serine protease
MRRFMRPSFLLALCASQTAIGVELTPTATIAAKGTLPRSTHAVSHTTETTRPLVLRGGASTEEKTVKFALINVALYAALFRGMTKFGGIRFVTFACWAVWGLWMASSSAFKVMMVEVLAKPKESFLALASALLNVTDDQVVDEDGEAGAHSFLKDGDVKELHVERGANVTIPSETLLLDCDNGMEWAKLKDGVEFTKLVRSRGELITLELVNEATYMKRKQHHTASKCDDERNLEFDDDDYELVTVWRGESFVFPSHLLLVEWDNGLGDKARGSDGLEGVQTFSQLRERSQHMTLRFVSESTLCKRWAEALKPDLLRDSALLKASGKFFKRFQGLMERTFLAPPGGWRRMRLQPFALFGSVFSHMSIDHISGNLGVLQMCHEAEEWLGTAKFAHLYLTSGLIASVFRCIWQQYDLRAHRKQRKLPSLGASGAISGVMAWWCIECFKRGEELVFNDDHRVSPLVFWAAYVAIDLSGMLRLGAAQKVLNSYLDKLVGHKEEEGKGKPRGEVGSGNVGYDAHIGGAIAGLLWQLPSLLRYCLLR